MAKRVGDGCVFAFEPNPQLAGYLREVAGDFPSGRVRVVESALSDRQGTAVLHFPGKHLGSASLELSDDVLQPPVDVATITLDNYFQALRWTTPIRLIKCDVEYHELAVLRGAEQTLSRHKPVLLVESGDFVNQPLRLQPVNRYLNELGYLGCFFHKSRLVPIEHFDPAIHSPVNDDHQNYVYTHSDAEVLSRTRSIGSRNRLARRSVA
jgi:FkbM family methyltransferase